MAGPPPVDIASTLGALLVGGSIALMLSGIVIVQCIVYYKLYPNDARIRTIMVLAVWILDLLHSAFIVTSLFDYFIRFFGDRSKTDFIPWSVALSVVATAIQTLIVHWYFAHKIFQSSGKSWLITAPIVVLAFLRLLAASVSTAEMIILQKYSAFTRHYPGWVFTTGLSLSASVDIIITGWLCYFLQKMRKRTRSTPMARVMHTLTLYTLENGLITCVATTASLISWLKMPYNLVFLGLHFVIGKLYANSLLISLNTRKSLREMRWKQSDTPSASAWPVLGLNGVTSPYTPTYAGGAGAMTFTYPYGTVTSYEYGGVSGVDMSSPTDGYRPAFKVPAVSVSSPSRARARAVDVGRAVRRASDDISISGTSDVSSGTAGRRNAADHMRSLP